MNNSERLKKLIESGRTVFTPRDCRMLWGADAHNAKICAFRMSGKGLITRIADGYYALNDRYNRYELANRLLSPSYVSFQSALFLAGINFQARGEIGSVARRNAAREAGGTVYRYYAMKESLFFNTEGVVMRNGVAVAVPERAILDSYYFGFLPDIDEPDKLNKTYLKTLSASYPLSVRKKTEKYL